MDDLISRQAAIDLTWKDPSYSDPLNVLTEVRDGIKALPSAQRTGRWIDKMLDHFRKYEVVCSECGARYIGNYDSYDEPYEFNYCPNCGADMRRNE